MFSRVKTALMALVMFGALTLGLGAYYEEINVINRTGEQAEYLFVSPGDSDFWGPDLLGGSTYLSNGKTHSFYCYFNDEVGSVDIMIVGKSGKTYTVYDHDLLGEEYDITVSRTDQEDDSFDLKLSEVTLENNTGFEIYNIFFSPEDSDIWGADLLDSETTLEDGASHTFYVPQSRTVTYNLKAIDEDSDSYQYDVTLRVGTRVTREITIDDYVPSDDDE